MKKQGRITSDCYQAVDYHQYAPSRILTLAMQIAGILTWPIILPLALLARSSDFVFRTIGEVLALVPFLFGVIMRYEFYRFTLRKCGKNVNIGFGTVLLYRDICIGDHVSIGNYVSIHYCDIGSYALVADGCRLLSGTRYHNFDRFDIPMALQGGQLRRIILDNDCWVGANSVIMADVGTGAIVGAGAVVLSRVKPKTIVAGNPAKRVAHREDFVRFSKAPMLD
jgi:acetyltransferase-like isoleucine patch superfamily enzyme